MTFSVKAAHLYFINDTRHMDTQETTHMPAGKLIATSREETLDERIERLEYGLERGAMSDKERNYTCLLLDRLYLLREELEWEMSTVRQALA